MNHTWETHYARHMWRIAPTDYRGHRCVEIWPHYRTADGEWRHGGGRQGGGGLKIPIDQAEEVAAAIIAAAAQLR